MSGGRGPVRALPWETHRDDGALAGVQDAELLVLAGSEDAGPVRVPAGTVDHVRVQRVHTQHGLATRHVPQDEHVIAAWGRGARESVFLSAGSQIYSAKTPPKVT